VDVDVVTSNDGFRHASIELDLGFLGRRGSLILVSVHVLTIGGDLLDRTNLESVLLD